MLGLYGVLQAVRWFQDTNEPVSVVRLQLGLRLEHSMLQERLRQLRTMMQVGQQGLWLILEETTLEMCKYQRAVAYADVECGSLRSKTHAYDVFKQVASQEVARATAEEFSGAILTGEAAAEVAAAAAARSRNPLRRMFRGPNVTGSDEEEARQEMVVVTLVVAARGQLDIPRVRGWQDVRHTLQQLAGLSSDRLMAIELLWTPDSSDDFLSEARLLCDYPHLVAFRNGERVGVSGRCRLPAPRTVVDHSSQAELAGQS